MAERIRRPRAVLFDRDGTLVVDVAYNGDPARVQPMPTVETALRMLRATGIATGVVTNQSGIGRGIVDADAVGRVNRRIDDLLGPFDVWQVCPHAPEDDCACRKPRPGMILEAAHRLGLAPADIAVIGDIGSDMEAAAAAGAQHVLVPTPVTRAEEVQRAALVAADVAGALALLLGDDDDDADDDGNGSDSGRASGSGSAQAGDRLEAVS